jgi:hypothetical protein
MESALVRRKENSSYSVSALELASVSESAAAARY